MIRRNFGTEYEEQSIRRRVTAGVAILVVLGFFSAVVILIGNVRKEYKADCLSACGGHGGRVSLCWSGGVDCECEEHHEWVVHLKSHEVTP